MLVENIVDDHRLTGPVWPPLCSSISCMPFPSHMQLVPSRYNTPFLGASSICFFYPQPATGWNSGCCHGYVKQQRNAGVSHNSLTEAFSPEQAMPQCSTHVGTRMPPVFATSSSHHGLKRSWQVLPGGGGGIMQQGLLCSE